MRIHELVEGKEYTIRRHSTKYRVRNGVFEFNDFGEWHKSDMTYNFAKKEDFTEIPQYVTFKEAIRHMSHGGECEFRNSIYGMIKNSLHARPKDGTFVYVGIATYMFEPKWILL